MKTQRPLVLALAFAVCFLAVGLPYWQIPYAQASLPDSLLGFGLAAVVLVAAASRFAPGIGLMAATLATGAAVPGAVMARVLYETMADPTSHNLWPFEAVIAIGLGLPAALLGAFAGGLLAPLLRGGR